MLISISVLFLETPVRQRLYILSILFFCITVSANTSEDKRLLQFLDNYYKIHLSYFPIEATENGFFTYNDLFTITIDKDFRDSYKIFLVNTLNSLESYEIDSLSTRLKVSHALLKYQLQQELEAYEFPNHLFLLDQYHFLLQFIRMGSGKGSQPFVTLKDYDNF